MKNEKICGAFDEIRAEEELKRRTGAYLKSKMRAEVPAKRPTRGKRLVLALACLALVLAGFGGYSLYFTPVSAISVDVNPSVGLSLNRFDRVVAAEGYNADGESVIASIDLKYMYYSDALEALLGSAEMRPYLENDAQVSIAVAGSTEAKSEELRARIAACRFTQELGAECVCASSDQAREAESAGLSLGKYRAFLQLRELDPSVTAEDVRNMSMRQIREAVERLEAVAGGGGGHGNGQGGAHGR